MMPSKLIDVLRRLLLLKINNQKTNLALLSESLVPPKTLFTSHQSEQDPLSIFARLTCSKKAISRRNTVRRTDKVQEWDKNLLRTIIRVEIWISGTILTSGGDVNAKRRASSSERQGELSGVALSLVNWIISLTSSVLRQMHFLNLKLLLLNG
jgi:hypothetical protein